MHSLRVRPCLHVPARPDHTEEHVIQVAAHPRELGEVTARTHHHGACRRIIGVDVDDVVVCRCRHRTALRQRDRPMRMATEHRAATQQLHLPH